MSVPSLPLPIPHLHQIKTGGKALLLSIWLTRKTNLVGLGIDATSWVDAGLISLETKRARDRTWHTAYIQDKLWSAYVGRAPAPNLSHWHMPFPTIDEEEDTGPWSNLDPSESKPVRTSRMASTFTWTCKLARIIELILTNM